MTVYRYPRRALVGDYVRTAAGLGVGLGVLATVPLTPAIVIVFGSLTGLFLVFGLRTVQRQLLQVAVTGEAISSAGLVTRTVPWPALELLTLRYYGTRRQRREGGGGFMQLTLRGAGASMRFESSIDGFESIARHAARAAVLNGIAIDPTSAGNLLGLGIDADSPVDG